MSQERQLLRWQANAEAKYLAQLRKDFLLVAWPGAGKTFWALHVARELIKAGRIARLAVVVPSVHLKGQWASTAAELGLSLAHDYQSSDGAWPRDCEGIAMTYSQVFTERALHRHNVAKQPTLVIMDEMHHLQDREGWGEAAKHAFDIAAYRLHLSGTPWNRNGQIPWIEYDEDGKCVAQESYSYRESLTDGVNCDVFFPKLGGQAEWEFDGEIKRASFDDKISDEDARRRLATMLSVDKSDLIKRAFRQADQQLSGIRAMGQHRAGGLIIARDVRHAKDIADKVVKPILGALPPVVTHDDPYAANLIRNFRRSSDRWLVSVRMVSEGVDIPRLRVLLYATNVRTRLFFQQAVGRVIRGPQPPACVYVPADEELLTYAREIKDMRIEALRRIQEPPEGNDGDGDDGEPPERISRWTPMRGESHEHGLVHESDEVTQAELEDARRELIKWGGTDTTVPTVTAVARLLRGQKQAPLFEIPVERDSEMITISERKEALRKRCNKIVQAYAFRIANGGTQTISEITQDCNVSLNSAISVARIRDATEEQLHERLRLAKERYGV